MLNVGKKTIPMDPIRLGCVFFFFFGGGGVVIMHSLDIQIPPEVRCFRYVFGVQIPSQFRCLDV